MSETELEVGIAGYGVVGSRRREYIDAHPNLRTIAVCDKKIGEGTMTVEDARSYVTYDQLLGGEDLDVLFVCLPNYLAPEVTIAGLEHGAHVFCEKPPGRTVDDIRRVREVEAEHPDQKLKYGFNHRYHDSVRDAKEIVESGEYGDILNVRGVYGKSKIVPFSGGWRASRKMAGGGILLDQGIHMLDLMRFFCGEFEEVKSFVSNDYWGHDVEDNAFALMKDQAGRVAFLHSTATQWEHRFNLEITFEEGFVELRGILSGSKSYGEERLRKGERSEADVGSLTETKVSYLEDNSWQDEVRDFARAILKDEPIQSGTSRDALETMKLVYRIYHRDPEWRKQWGIPDPDG